MKIIKKFPANLIQLEILGKYRLKFEMRSYEEMVVIPMKQMNEDNQQLIWLKNKVVKQEQQSKVLKETIGVITQRWRETVEENIMVRRRSKIQLKRTRKRYSDLYRALHCWSS